MNEIRTPIDQLIDRERIRGASRMIIPEGTDASAVSAAQIEEVINSVELFRRTYKISKQKIAEAVHYGHATIVEFMAGKYKGDQAKLAINLQAWLIEEEQRRVRPETTQFVDTNVALQIKSVANYCRDRRTIGLVFGPASAGIGKTKTLQAIHQTLGPKLSSMATMDKVDANPTGLLKKLLQSMHVEDRGTNKQRFDRLVSKLRGRSHIFLIDQIHNLRESKDDKPFYILTDLYDATNTAQLWCGTADMVDYLERRRKRNADESLAQIRSRIFPCIDLMEMLTTGGADGRGQPLATIEQVIEMFGKNKLRLTPAGARFICALINTPDSGGIRFAARVVEYATSLAEINGAKTIDVPAIKHAMHSGITEKRAQMVLHDVEEKGDYRIATAG